MNHTILLIAVSIVAVALLILGLSITLIRKGHHIQSEVGENDDMKKLGLKCASQEMREEEARANGDPLEGLSGCGGITCGECNVSCDETKTAPNEQEKDR